MSECVRACVRAGGREGVVVVEVVVVAAAAVAVVVEIKVPEKG